MRLVAWLLMALGAVLALPQIVATYPAQRVFAAGLLIALVGAIMVCDAAEGH